MELCSGKIHFAPGIWDCLCQELYARGQEVRETGAFLLGTRNKLTTKIDRIVFYDDLDPRSTRFRYIQLDRSAFSRLWQICREVRMDVVGDVHTHPGLAIQSPIDRANPMISTAGHLALILPHFASPPVAIKQVGIYQYGGNQRWAALAVPSAEACKSIGEI